MAIDKKLIYIKTESIFNTLLNNNEIDEKSIVFIEDSKRIWTHGNFFDGDWGGLNNKPSTLDGYGITDAAKKINSLYYVEGNTTGTAGSWTGSIPEVTSLYAGLTIAYKIGVAGASTTNLNLNGLGNKRVRRNTGNLTTHLPVGTVVLLTYDGTYWVWADYHTNTTYAAMSVDEGKAGTATSSRTMRADYLKQIVEHYIDNTAPSAHTHDYLPLSGGKLTGDLEIFAANTDKFIKFAYNTTDAYAWRIGYLGTGAGNENRLAFQSAKTSGASYVDALSFGLDDLVGRFAVTPTVGNTKVSLEGHNHTLKLIAGTSTATTDSTVDVADPYIRLFSDNVHQGNVRIVGGANVGAVSKNGVVTLTATDTTYSAGTLVLLDAGTNTSNRVWSSKILNDWLNPKLALKATPSDITNAIDGIEIGGRNLARLTNSREWGRYVGGTLSFGEYKGITTIKSTDDGSGYIGIIQSSNAGKMLLRAGEQYTISLLIRGTRPLAYNYIMHTGPANNSIGNFTYEQPLNEETFVKAYITITAGANFELSTGSYFMTRPTVVNAGDWVEITQLKIERGNKATDYSPAPEDQVSDWNESNVNSFAFLKNKPTKLTLTGAVTGNTTLSSGELSLNTSLTAHTHTWTQITGTIPTWNQSTTGNAATASAVSTSADNSSTTSRYILFADSASGNQALKTDTGLKYVPSTNTISANISGNLSGGTVNGTALGVTNVSASTGLGLSLYGGPTTGIPQYGITFAGTPTFGTHGAVTGDWATYFTMTGATSRGWIFKLGTTNVASISATGVVTATSFSGNIDASSLNTGTVPNARISGTYTGLTNLTGTGNVDFARFIGNAGDTVTAPSITWTGDLNTGIYRPGASQVAITTGGAQRALFNSSGVSFSGTTTVSGDINGTSAAFSIKASGTDVFRMSGVNPVISTKSTGTIYLRPNGSSSSVNEVTINSTGIKVGTTNVSLDGHTHNYLPLSGGTLSGEISIVKSGEAGVNTRFLTLRDTDYGTNLGRVDIAILATNTNTATNRGAVISMRRTNSLGTLHFEVADNNLLSLIGHSQNVGIGTTSPTEKLDVSGNIKASGTVTASSFISTVTSGFMLTGAKSTIYNAFGAPTGGGFSFVPNGGALSEANVALTIAANKNVGIGTISPAYKLDVSGTGRFTGSITSGGTITASNLTVTGKVSKLTDYQTQASTFDFTNTKVIQNIKGLYVVTTTNGYIAIGLPKTSNTMPDITVTISDYGSKDLVKYRIQGYWYGSYWHGNANKTIIEASSSINPELLKVTLAADQNGNPYILIGTPTTKFHSYINVNLDEIKLKYSGQSNVAWQNSANYTISQGITDVTGWSLLTAAVDVVANKDWVTSNYSPLVASAGSATQPVYFSGGKPVATTYSLGKSVPSNAVFTDTHWTSGIRVGASGTAANTAVTSPYIKVVDNESYREQFRLIGGSNVTITSDASKNITISSTNTVYSHPTYTAYASGLYKITTNTLGHVTGATAVVKSDITGLGIPSSDTNSVTGITAGASGTTTNASTSNPYIKVKDDSTHRSQIRLVGSGATTVSSDASGNVTISSTNTNTTYSAGSGLSLSGTTFNVNYGTTSGTAAQGNDSRITNGNTAYGWGNHASAGYLTSIPLASTTVIGGGYLVNNTKANVTLSRTTTANRYYPVQLNTSNQMMVNVPWTDTTSSYTLPTASTTTLGGVKLFSNTTQTVAASSVTSTSNRTYGIQTNSSGQLVVNVPWTNTNTTYSEITEAQTVSTSSSVVGLITGRRLKYAFDNITAANATNATTATNATNINTLADNSTNADRFILFSDAATGNQRAKTDTGLKYNPSSNTITATLAGNASSATYASAVTLTADNTTNATRYPLFVDAATGNLSPRTDTGFKYNPSTGALTSTSFVGSLTGLASLNLPLNGGTLYGDLVIGNDGRILIKPVNLATTPTSFFSSTLPANRSEFGANGLMVAASANQYSFMVGDNFEVRRQNHMLKVNSSGIQISKNGGSQWSSLFSGLLGIVHFTLNGGITYQWTKDGSTISLSYTTSNPFRVNHNFGHSNYFAIPIAQARNGYLIPSARYFNYCTFEKVDIDGGHQITVLLIGHG